MKDSREFCIGPVVPFAIALQSIDAYPTYKSVVITLCVDLCMFVSVSIDQTSKYMR